MGILVMSGMNGKGLDDCRRFLAEIRNRVGMDVIVSACWDGAIMKVLLAAPKSGKAPFVANLDSPSDYERAEQSLSYIVKGAVEHFGRNEEGYLVELLEEAERK